MKRHNQFISWTGGIRYDPACTPHRLRSVQVRQGWQVASNHLLSGVDDILLSALVLGSGCCVPKGDGGCENGQKYKTALLLPLAYKIYFTAERYIQIILC